MSDATLTDTATASAENRFASMVLDTDKNCFDCRGAWTLLFLKNLPETLDFELPPKKDATISISGANLEAFDSAGALTLLTYIQKLQSHYQQIDLIHFSDNQRELLSLIETKTSENPPLQKAIEKKDKKEDFLEILGREAIHKFHQFDGLVVLVGDLTNKFFIACADWRRFHLPNIISNIHSGGLKALPILALLSFLIGVVLAYQMGVQLRTYGATNFIAYISGMAIFREFAPLITAIIVAGRTSSAFTAQIGSMKVNEEIDALHTMGLSPTELLVLPKVFGLLFIFPFIIFWSDVFSILGAMMMAKGMLDVGYYDFLTRLQTDVGADQLMLGLYKAPAFAVLIALVGCFQGFQVQTNANSIGSQTTKSVVQALFLIIITDAIYSVIYQWMDL